MLPKLYQIILIFNGVMCFQQTTLKDQIYDISTKISKKHDELQLSINWRDNVTSPKGIIKSFDVKVLTINSTICPPVPCLAYGVSPKMNITTVIVPANVNSVIENNECKIEPGCWYKIHIATSDRKVERSIQLEIPDCIYGICSCRHSIDFPIVEIETDTHTNNSIRLLWKLSIKDIVKGQLKNFTLLNTLEYLQIDALSMKMQQKTNPTLSWGGNPVFMGQHQLFLNSNSSQLSKNSIKGIFTFHTNNQLIAGESYLILCHVIDNKNCWGPERRFEFTIEPSFNELNQPSITKTNVLLVIIPVAIVILTAIACVILIFRRQHTVKKSGHISLGNLEWTKSTIYEEGDIYEISPKEITISIEIGSGAFGHVYKGVARNLCGHPNSTVVAVKKLKKLLTVDEIDEFRGEIQTLKKAGHHENIVALLGCCTIKEPYMMIMEYVGRGDLLKYLHKVGEHVRCKKIIVDIPVARSNNNRSNNASNYLELKFSSNTSTGSEISSSNPAGDVRPSVTETMYTMLGDLPNAMGSDESDFQYILDHKELHNFAIQICRGMKHLEERKITHRDLAARNILIDDRKTLKISDFGLSRDGIYINTKARKLPVRWLSIEAMRDRLYSSKSDVWAFGIVLWEIGNLGSLPYPTMEYKEILDFLSMGKRLEKPGICTDELYELILRCWNENLSDRPSFADISKWLEPLTKTIYVDISNISDDYVFPPTTATAIEAPKK